MSSTELQTRLKTLTYRTIILYECLSSATRRYPSEGQKLLTVSPPVRKLKVSDKVLWNQGFKTKLSFALEQIREELFVLEGLVDHKLISPAKLSLIVQEATELTRIFASYKMTFERKPGPNHNSKN